MPGKQGCYDVRPSFKSLGFPFEKLYLLVSQWEETRDCLKGGPTCALKRYVVVEQKREGAERGRD